MTLITEKIDIHYQLNFEAAFHFGTGLRNGLIHRAVAQTVDQYLYVPGSTLKGVLRARCEQIARLFDLQVTEPHHEDNARMEARIHDPNIVARIFGSRFYSGQLYFDDAILLSEDRKLFDGTKNPGRYKNRQVETRTQVSLSRRTQTAKAQHLFSSEYGLRLLRFEGSIYGHLTGFSLETGGTYSLLLLLAGLSALDRLGGNKSTGAGQVQCEVKTVSVAGVEIDINDILDRLPELEYYELEREGVS